jgi:hypothetical protein
MNCSKINARLGLAALLLLVGAGSAVAQYARPSAYLANSSTAADFSPCGAYNIATATPVSGSSLSNVYTNVETEAPKTGPGPVTWYDGPAWGVLAVSGFNSSGTGNQTAAYFSGFPAAVQQSGTAPVLWYSETVADGQCAYIMVSGGGVSTGAINIYTTNCFATPGGSNACSITLPTDTDISGLQVWFCVQGGNSPSGPPGFIYIQDIWVDYVPA